MPYAKRLKTSADLTSRLGEGVLQDGFRDGSSRAVAGTRSHSVQESPPMSSRPHYRRRTYRSNKWGSWASFSVEPSNETTHHCISLPRGGRIRLFPSLIPAAQCAELVQELEKSALFREYPIQGGFEPRAHFLLHDEATADFAAQQPGYRYGQVNLKARPLKTLPGLEALSDDMKMLCLGAEGSWNIGVNPIYYRSGRDKLGFHSDNDQGEDVILTVLLACPSAGRRVLIETGHEGKRKTRQEGDEQYELVLHSGDAYEMDGAMQKHYVHGVPADTRAVEGASKRVAVVFRHGRQVIINKDSGRPVVSLAPRVQRSRIFGDQVEHLVEGSTYIRRQLLNMAAHCAPQAGISGNKSVGCDAIIVAGQRKDADSVPTLDHFHILEYAAQMSIGAGALLTSHVKKMPVRVFRSSKLQGFYKAEEVSGRTGYRYDGIYEICNVRCHSDNNLLEEGKLQRPSSASGRCTYIFRLKRIASRGT